MTVGKVHVFRKALSLAMALGLGALFALPLAGCAPQQPTAPSGAGPGATPKAGSEQPKSGGALNWAWYVEPVDNDPHTAVGGIHMWDLAGNGLVKVEHATQKVAPDLAESWEQPDNRTYIFHLNKGAKFQNVPPVNGREFTSNDVLYSIKRMMTDKPEFARRSYFEGLDKVEAPDKYTVKMTTKEPFGPLLMYLGSMYSKMVAKEVVDKLGDLKRPEAAIGTGPFLFKEHTRDVGGSAVKNPDYFVKGRPYLDEIRWQVITDDATRAAALRTGQSDISQRIAPPEYESLKNTNPNIKWDKEPAPWAIFLLYRVDKPPFNDVRVRRAMSLAIDRSEVISGAHQGAATLTGPLPPGMVPWAALADDELRQMPGYRQAKDQDLADAKKLMADAGLSGGLDLTFDMTDSYAILNKWPAEVVVGQLAKIGIRTKTKMMDGAAFFKAERDGTFDLRTRGITAYFEPDEHLWTAFHSTGSRNYSKLTDKYVDDTLTKGRTTIDPGERKKIYTDVQKYLIDQAICAWIDEPFNYSPYQPYVRNYDGRFILLSHLFSDVWLAK